MECSIQRGEATLNRPFHLLPNENICTITQMKNIHYLFHIASTIYVCHLQPLYTGKRQFCFDRAVSGQRSPQCTIDRCTVSLILQGTIAH